MSISFARSSWRSCMWSRDKENSAQRFLKGRAQLMLPFYFSDGGNKSAAKLTDLDPEARLFSEIWGWRLRLGDFFSADYSPVPFQYVWKKMVKDPRGSYTFGAAYQSVLSNIRWIQNNSDSSFVTKLQKAMENKNIDSSRLSIRLTMDMYQNDSTKNSFTTGRITGTICGDWWNSFFARKVLSIKKDSVQSSSNTCKNYLLKIYSQHANFLNAI